MNLLQITLPEYDILTLKNDLNFLNFCRLFNEFVEECHIQLLTLEINQSGFPGYVNSFLKDSYLNKINYKSKLKKLNVNTDVNISNLLPKDKELSSFGIKSSAYANVDDFYILAKLSEFQYIYDKTVQRTTHAINYISKSEVRYMKVPSLQSKIKSDFDKNIRTHLSSIASIVLVKYEQGLSQLENLLHNRNKSVMIENIKNLRKLNITDIFVVDGSSYPIDPRFNRLHYYDTTIDNNYFKLNLNYLSLNDFCLLVSTLKKESKSLKNIKVDFSDGININDELSIDSLELTKYISDRIDLKNSIIIFKSCKWSTILENFYKYGLEVSGGSGVKRHIISPMDYTLSLFLNILSENGYKDTVTSTNLTDKTFYESKISKTNDCLYNKDLFKNKIIDAITNIEPKIYPYMIDYHRDKSLSVDDELNIDKQVYSYLRHVILNEMIFTDLFLNINELGSEPFLRLDWRELFIYRERNLVNAFYDVIATYDFISAIPKYKKNGLRKEKMLYFYNKIYDQKREYSTNCKKSFINNFNTNSNNRISFLRKINKNNIKQFSTNSILSQDQLNNNSRLNITDKEINIKDIILTNKNDLFYKNITSLLEIAKTNPILAQSKIEEEWIDIVINDINTNQNLLRNKLNFVFNKAKETLNIKRLQQKLIKEFGETGKLLNDEKHLFITLMVIIDSYKNSSHTMVAYQVGYNILRNIFNKYIDSTNTISFFDFISLVSINRGKINIKILKQNLSFEELNTKSNLLSADKKDIEIINCQNQFLINIGVIFIDIFVQEPINMFNLNYPQDLKNIYYDNLNTPLKLVLNEEYKGDLFDRLVIHPKNIPMVCEPLEWDYNKYGGYLLNIKLKEDIITGSVRYHKHNLDGAGKIKLYNTINYFNKIKFNINKSLLNYLIENGDYLIKLDTDNLYNNYISIKMADLFKDITFYLHTHADWRGRIYTHCFYLSYQGSDLATALIQFEDGFTLTNNGLDIFLAYGATLYDSNLNKKSIQERIDWIKMNKIELLNMNKEFIVKAKSPFLFTAFCLEIQKLEKNPNSKIYSPVFIDATCSGVQHLSAMIGDSDLGKLVNLTASNRYDRPADFYQELVEPINKAINNYGKINPEYKSLSNLYLTRDELKRPIMTQNYNVSIFGMKQQLFEIFKVKDNTNNVDTTYNSEYNLKTRKTDKIIGFSKEGANILLTHKDLIRISMIIKEVIFINYPVLKEIYDYFLKIADINQRLQLPVQWITPAGAVITQEYKKRTSSKVRVFIHNKTKVNIIKNITPNIDFKKQKDGIIPNVIHSLDSSHIINLINDLPLDFGSPILTVHDCFGAHPNFIDIIEFRLKEEFIKIYTNNKFLKTLNKRLIQNIKDNNYDIIKENKNYYVIIENNQSQSNINKLDTTEKILIPKPPIKNSLDILEIKKSKYMFN